MNEIIDNAPWILARLLCIRKLEAEVRRLLATGNPPRGALRRRMAELNAEVTLLDLVIN